MIKISEEMKKKMIEIVGHHCCKSCDGYDCDDDFGGDGLSKEEAVEQIIEVLKEEN